MNVCRIYDGLDLKNIMYIVVQDSFIRRDHVEFYEQFKFIVLSIYIIYKIIILKPLSFSRNYV